MYEFGGEATALQVPGNVMTRVSRWSARSIDQALVSALTRPERMPSLSDAERVNQELLRAHALYGAGGARMDEHHRAPSSLAAHVFTRRRHLSTRYEQLTFASDYEIDPRDLSRARWLSYPGNHSAHAFVLRHDDKKERPWLFCMHGLGTGRPFMDFPAFRVAQLHRELGVNLVFPLIPLHGLRRARHVSIAALASYELLDTFHGISQAVHDTRRLMRWAREQGASRIGLYGMSIGAYVGSLVSALEELDVLIAGIPLCDMPDLMQHHADLTPEQTRLLLGAEMRELFRLVSPLSSEPRTPVARRAIYAGSDDLVTTAGQAHRLWTHWQKPSVHWYGGGHVSFFWARSLPRFVRERLIAADFTA